MTDEAPSRGDVSVVVVTRDRRDQLVDALEHLVADDRPVTVVDNGSTDGTSEMVRNRYPAVRLLALDHNLGGAGRNLGVAASGSPYVAFSDDDSWWAPGALDRASHLLDRHPEVAVVAGRVLVGADERLDPACAEMADSPIPRRPSDPGPAVLGFLACGAIVRADAFLDVGGFDPDLGVGGEEELLALDLAAAGWRLVYIDDIVAHHHPAVRSAAGVGGRQRRQARNALKTAWMRLPAGLALREALRVVAAAGRTSAGRRGIVDAVREWRDVRARRHVVPSNVAADRRCL